MRMRPVIGLSWLLKGTLGAICLRIHHVSEIRYTLIPLATHQDRFAFLVVVLVFSRSSYQTVLNKIFPHPASYRNPKVTVFPCLNLSIPLSGWDCSRPWLSQAAIEQGRTSSLLLELN